MLHRRSNTSSTAPRQQTFMKKIFPTVATHIISCVLCFHSFEWFVCRVECPNKQPDWVIYWTSHSPPIFHEVRSNIFQCMLHGKPVLVAELQLILFYHFIVDFALFIAPSHGTEQFSKNLSLLDSTIFLLQSCLCSVLYFLLWSLSERQQTVNE